MRFVCLLTLILAPLFLQRTISPETHGLIVLKFRCGKYERGSGIVSSVQDPGATGNEPIRVNPTSRNEPQEVKNRQDMQERRAEMRAAEINAALSGQPESKLYFYRIQIQNTGDKAMKSFVWEYQPSEEPEPTDRQFYCVINAKPSEKKEFELFSPLAPSRVIDASKLGDKPNLDRKANVVVNKIEYMDGSVWIRPSWNPKTFAPEDTKKVAGGKCIGI